MGGFIKSLEDAVKGVTLAALLGTSMFSSASETPAFAQQQKQQNKLQDPKKAQEPKQDDKKPVPKSEDIKKKEAEIKDLYKEQFATSDVSKLRTLAQKLSSNAMDSTDPAERYVLLDQTRIVSAKGLDIYGAYEAVRKMASSYDLKTDTIKNEIFSIAKEAATIPEKKEMLAGSMVELAESATREDDYELATKAIKEVGSLAPKNSPLSQKASQISKEIPEMKRMYEDAKKLEERIKKNPNDLEANFKFGIYRCSKDDWVTGPMYLKDGNDVEVMVISNVDIRKPKDSQDQYDLAERWYAWAEKQKGAIEKKVGRTRARFWYETSLEGKDLAGLTRDKAEKRLKEIEPATKGGLVDLLKMVDPTKDAVAGKWKMQEGKLVLEGVTFSRIEMPYRVPEEYDLTVGFSTTNDKSEMNYILSAAGREFSYVAGGWENTISGFEMINGAAANSNATTYKSSRILEAGHQYTSLIQVRKTGVKAYLDGKLISELKTNNNYNDISVRNEWKLRDQKLLGFGAHTNITLSKIELKEITGKGERSR